MGNPLEERLRTVERDWDELRRQNNLLIELNNRLTRERDRLREALCRAEALVGMWREHVQGGAGAGWAACLRQLEEALSLGAATPACLCVFAVGGATFASMAEPGPQHDARCPKHREAAFAPDTAKEG
jgi:hypothetical protein